MKICVCGAQVPFTRGGAELHMDNLVAAFRAAGHQAELVRLPVAWERERLFDAALAWRLVPMDADLVVATNFPSYFVRHPRKVVWLFHQHRGAYDAADTPWSGFGLDDDSLETQRLLTDWDCRALEEAERLFCTSETVADRLLRYNGVIATPLAHPPPLHDLLAPGPATAFGHAATAFGYAATAFGHAATALGHAAGGGRTVFCPTRLAANKRPELLVEAMSFVSAADVRAVLAGEGPLRDELEAMRARLGVTDRVEMCGFVPDDDLVRRYAEAMAVVYAPFDEDYGYVTLQAFLAAKPVITAKDSGGVLEWVEDGVTGIVTDGSPAAIGAAIDRLAAEPELARRMGETGKGRVAGLSWGPVVTTLLGQDPT